MPASNLVIDIGCWNYYWRKISCAGGQSLTEKPVNTLRPWAFDFISNRALGSLKESRGKVRCEQLKSTMRIV